MTDFKTQENIEANKASRRKTRYEKVEAFSNSVVQYTVLILTFPLDIIGALLKEIFGFMDETKIIPRVALIIGVCLTLYAFQWAFMFVKGVTIAQLTGTELAGVIAAVLTPIAGLITILIRYGSGGAPKDDDKQE